MKKYSIIILFVLVISFASAIKFGISPDKVVLKGESDDLICANITILGDRNLIFEGDIRLSEVETKNLADYKLTPEEANLKVLYDKETFKGEKQICISGKNMKYYGALTYKIVGTNYGVGTWLEIDIGNENRFMKTFSITGNAIRRVDNSEQMGLGAIFVSLLILAIFAFKSYNQRKKLISSRQ